MPNIGNKKLFIKIRFNVQKELTPKTKKKNLTILSLVPVFQVYPSIMI